MLNSSIGKTFKWINNATTLRADPVTRHEWETHRAELCHRYAHMTLEELMAYMKTTYGFKASKRQYVSQFKKWDIRKYGHAARTARVQPQASSFEKKGSDRSNERGSQLLEYGSRDSSTAAASESTEHGPSKRTLPSTFTSGTDISSSRPAKIQRNDLLPTADCEEEHPKALALPDKPQLAASESSRSPHSIPEDFETWIIEQGPFSVQAVAHCVRVTNDVSLGIHSFSKADIRNMKFAADFLHVTSHETEACALYSMIIIYMKCSKGFPEWMKTWTMIACARSASNTPQREMAAGLLRSTVEEAPGKDMSPEKYVSKKLLSLLQNLSGGEFEQECDRSPRDTGTADRSMLAGLPVEHRTFDLCTYAFFVSECRNRTRLGLLSSDCPPVLSAYDGTHGWPESAFLQYLQVIQDQLLFKKSGPFEIVDGRMRNPCLRSCIYWCYNECAKDSNTTPMDMFTTRLLARETRPLKPGEDDVVESVFVGLWSRWQFHRTNTRSHFPEWTTKAETLMGISACEVLRCVIRMCIAAVPSDDYIDNFSRAEEGAAILVKMGHDSVARMFLDSFVDAFHATQPSKRSWLLGSRDHGGQVRFDEYSLGYSPKRKAEPIDVRNLLKRTKNALPPLAPSLRSSERSLSFRQFKPLQRGYELTRPSSVYKERPEDGLTYLSESFRSLSLRSPGPETISEDPVAPGNGDEIRCD